MLGYGFTRKQKAMLERPARDKHSSLLDPFLNYSLKNSYNIGPGISGENKAIYKPFLTLKQFLLK
jgi:hypothetical protein